MANIFARYRIYVYLEKFQRTIPILLLEISRMWIYNWVHAIYKWLQVAQKVIVREACLARDRFCQQQRWFMFQFFLI